MTDLRYLPNLSLDKPSPANLTDSDSQDFYHVVLNFGGFYSIIECKDICIGGSKMAILRNSQVLRTVNFSLIPGSSLSIGGIVRVTNSDDFSKNSCNIKIFVRMSYGSR